jgi:hypothetical protein
LTAATGDFNGDCKSDVLWRNPSTGQVYIWLMNGTAIAGNASPGSPTTDWVIEGIGDFNGDGKSDILWRNSTSGQVYIWLMNGTTIVGNASPGSPTTDWVIEGIGDFDGDGKSDILWRNSTSGQVYIWLMNGTTIAGNVSPASPTTDWSIQGIGDFNGDGKSDILWRNSISGQVYIWLMNGTAIAGNASPGSPTTDWVIEGIGDFNGDGMSDILWRNSSSGQVYIWLMDGTTIAGNASPDTPTTDWSIQGLGDFDGDGKTDILWRNSTSGQVYIWLMNGTTIAGNASPASPTPESSTECCVGVGDGWSILDVGDFDGDGKSDILWQQLSTGQVYIWLMNGTTIVGNASPASPAPEWQVATLPPLAITPSSLYGCSDESLCNILSATNNARANGPFGSGNETPSQTASGPLNPMVWDPGAATVAANWAATCNFSHNPNRDGGENIYEADAGGTSPVPITGTDAVNDWMSESAYFTYSTNTCNTAASPSGSCGHYTQLAWRTTTGMGCAVQQCPGSSSPNGDSDPWVIVVCDFTPAGNWPVQPY